MDDQNKSGVQEFNRSFLLLTRSQLCKPSCCPSNYSYNAFILHLHLAEPTGSLTNPKRACLPGVTGQRQSLLTVVSPLPPWRSWSQHMSSTVPCEPLCGLCQSARAALTLPTCTVLESRVVSGQLATVSVWNWGWILTPRGLRGTAGPADSLARKQIWSPS